MSIISYLAKKLSRTPAPSPATGTRKYSAGIPSRTSNGVWGGISYSRSMDAELRNTLRGMRAHSRHLYQNNDYYKKFVRLVVKNTVGPSGFSFRNAAKNVNGKPDTLVNLIIRDAWQAWSKKGNCDVTGKMSFLDCQRLFMQTVPTDGEILVRIVRNFPNAARFAIQFIEADHLDENYNSVEPNGNEIRMGVEFDQWDRPIAYHILVKHPGDYTYQRAGNRYERVPASDIIHAFPLERPRQTRGVPWGHTAMTRLNNLGGFEESAIIAAQAGASKMGFLTKPSDDTQMYGGSNPDGNSFVDANGRPIDAQGNLIDEVYAGSLESLPPGWDFKEFNPGYPNGEFDPFTKRTLKGIAAGLDVAYHKLASDLEGVNYSSARAGELDDRDTWCAWQNWMRESFLDPVFSAWLDFQLMAGALTFPTGSALPYAKFDKFNSPSWRSRSWMWVDPLKDLMATEKELANKLTSRTRITLEQGEDFEEILVELQAERELAKKYGIDLIDPMPSGSQIKLGAEPVAPEDAP